MELLLAIKITALVALLAFIVVSVFFLVSFKNILSFIRETSNSVNKVKTDFSRSVTRISDDISSLKDDMSVTLRNVDKLSVSLTENSQDISEIKLKVIDSLAGVDKLTESLKLNSADVTDMKKSFGNTMEHINSLTLQLKSTSKVLEKDAEILIEAVKPFADAIKLVKDNVRAPYSKVSSYISAASKAFSTFISYMSAKDGGDNGVPRREPVSENDNDDPIDLDADDVIEQVHLPGIPDDYRNHRDDKSGRASDKFDVVDSGSYKKGSPGEKTIAEGLLSETIVETEKMLDEAEKAVDDDETKSDDEKKELKDKISELRKEAKISSDKLRQDLFNKQENDN